MAKKKEFLQGGAPAQINRPSLLTPEHVEVRCHATNPELVEIVIGNSVLTVHYENGLQLSQWLRVRSKEAKRKAGDTSRHWSAVGILDQIKG